MPLLFNPENDLALGLGCRHYTPPPRVSALHRAGALMPAWWAGEGECVLAPDATDREVEWLRREFGIDVARGSAGEPKPWGWSADALRQFVVAGVDGSLLPSEADVDKMRGLSHRRTSIDILRGLGCPELAGCEVSAVEDIAVPESGGLFLKSPWSCSGRGVFGSRGLARQVVLSKAAGIIHRQGCVMVEREFDRVRDFAALFRSDGVSVRFAGWSVFVAEPRGAYTGNIVAPQSVLEGMIGHEVDITGLEKVLTRIVAPVYSGPLGIDMMVYKNGGTERVHPCIELNLRMTMGFVAMAVRDRLSLDTPAMLGWEYGSHVGETLLLPVEGFTLTLRRRYFEKGGN